MQGRRKKNVSETSRNFVIGIRSKSKIKYGKVNLAMVALWEETISNDDITLIYKTGRVYIPYKKTGINYSTTFHEDDFYAFTHCDSVLVLPLISSNFYRIWKLSIWLERIWCIMLPV